MVDFASMLSPEARERLEGLAKDRHIRTLGEWRAEDESRGYYRLLPHLSPDLQSLCFGQPCCYDLEGLRQHVVPRMIADGSVDCRFVYDAGGRNHRDVAGVGVTKAQFLDIYHEVLVRRSSASLAERSETVQTGTCCPDLSEWDRFRRQQYRPNLAALECVVGECRSCPHGSTRQRLVFDRGDMEAEIAVVGEAPGEDEDRVGEPFVGAAGELVERILRKTAEYAVTECKFAAPPTFYITNVLKCRPPDNRLLSVGKNWGADVSECRHHLFAQLRLLPRLRVIVALGRVAAQVLMNTNESISYLRQLQHDRYAAAIAGGNDAPFLTAADRATSFGCPDVRGGLVVVPTFHPSYLLRQPHRVDLRQQCWADMQLAVWHLHAHQQQQQQRAERAKARKEVENGQS